MVRNENEMSGTFISEMRWEDELVKKIVLKFKDDGLRKWGKTKWKEENMRKKSMNLILD